MRALLLATVLTLAAPLAAQPVTPVAAEATARADAELAAFFDAQDKANLARSPQAQTYRGIRGPDYGKWDDQSDAADVARHRDNMAALAEMRARFAGAPLSPSSRLSYRLFEKQMLRRDTMFRYRNNGYVFDQMNGAQSDYPAFLVNMHRITDASDARAYVSRLNGIAAALDQNIAESEARAKSGVLPPKWVFPYVISDAKNVVTGAPFDGGPDSPLFADFKAKVAKLKLPQGEADALIAEATAALTGNVGPAYNRLIAAMERQQARAGDVDGVWRFKDGAGYYTAALGYYTTTDLTPEQVHDLGLAQVKRIHGEMMDIARGVGFQGDLPAFLKRMRDDKGFYLPDGGAGKAEYLKRANAYLADIAPKLPQYFSRLPKSPVVVKAVEPFREKSAGKAFYQSPAEDGSRPGTVYVNLYRMADMTTTEIEPLIYHEGMPGHHLERAQSTELKGLPAFRKFGGYNAYSEGWGLYTEKLAKEMGQYRDPYSDFGRLQLELHRAIRLVVDSGIHHKRWSKEQAVQYTLANSAETEGAVRKAMERYSVYPGQATAYMVGRLKIMDLREKARTALGDRFDIRDFHDVVLSSGAVPLDVLEENVDAWVAARRAA